MKNSNIREIILYNYIIKYALGNMRVGSRSIYEIKIFAIFFLRISLFMKQLIRNNEDHKLSSMYVDKISKFSMDMVGHCYFYGSYASKEFLQEV